MKTTLIFILGILFGIGISLYGYNYIYGNKYAILNQDYELTNGGILKKGTKIKYNGSFPEGFEQYSLYLNMSIRTDNEITIEKEKFAVIPYWIKPKSENLEFDKRIIGDWGIYIRIFGGSGLYCNACPRINFKENKTAILTLSNEDKEYYNWNLQKDKLTLNSQGENTLDNYFDSSEYKIEIKNKEEFIELKILQNKESGYILKK